MAHNIGNGVDRTLEALNKHKIDELNVSWRDLKNKLDSLLLSTNVLKTNDSMRSCCLLDTMSTEEREEYIRTNWGPLYLDRAKPILAQLEILESKLK